MKKLTLPLAFLAAFVVQGSALAATAGESATISWGTYKETGAIGVLSESSATNAFVDPGPVTSDPASNWTSFLISSESGSGVFALGLMSNIIFPLSETSLFGDGVLPAATPSAYANSYRAINFTLGAGDSATFSFNYLLAVSTAGLPVGASYDDNVNAILLGTVTGSQLISLAATGTKSGTFKYTVTNNTSGVADETLYLGAASYEYTSAVPEPSTYALLLAGMGLIGVVSRRKWKKR